MAGPTYRVVATDAGLRVAHRGHPDLDVVVEPWAFLIPPDVRVPLSGARAVGEHLAAVLARRRGPVGPLHGAPELPPHAWQLAGHALEARARLLRRVNPVLAALIAAVEAVSDDPPQILTEPALHANRWLVRDVLAHRAAAIAVGHVHGALRRPWWATPEALVAALAEWRGLFAPDGRPYRSLDRTLMNLPAAVPPACVPALRHVRLERPASDPTVLTTLLLAAATWARRDRAADFATSGHAATLQRATAADVAAALEIVGAATGRLLEPHRQDHLQVLVQLLADDPEPWRGHFPGLAARTVRRHRAAAARPRPPARPTTGTRTVRPPIPLPDVPGIVFLDTVDAIAAEGDALGHCIADYAADAVAGRTYLFGIARGGERASVEVSPDGEVLQASGPRNAPNVAARWGARHLRAWARGLWSEERRMAWALRQRRAAARRAARG